mmetsp:Transcript_23351/g.51105  ORF Transcript_23351/g.51105 Transcript_23351/m.51105 type:complete len:298 (+) Transcript_23351:419-1312(+)
MDGPHCFSAAQIPQYARFEFLQGLPRRKTVVLVRVGPRKRKDDGLVRPRRATPSSSSCGLARRRGTSRSRCRRRTVACVLVFQLPREQLALCGVPQCAILQAFVCGSWGGGMAVVVRRTIVVFRVVVAALPNNVPGSQHGTRGVAIHAGLAARRIDKGDEGLVPLAAEEFDGIDGSKVAFRQECREGVFCRRGLEFRSVPLEPNLSLFEECVCVCVPFVVPFASMPLVGRLGAATGHRLRRDRFVLPSLGIPRGVVASFSFPLLAQPRHKVRFPLLWLWLLLSLSLLLPSRQRLLVR